MVLNPQTICKPLNYRELDFYQNIQDQDIKMFVPKYKGKLSRVRDASAVVKQTLDDKSDYRMTHYQLDFCCSVHPR